jgi:hypothetical protein
MAVSLPTMLCDHTKQQVYAKGFKHEGVRSKVVQHTVKGTRNVDQIRYYRQLQAVRNKTARTGFTSTSTVT